MTNNNNIEALLTSLKDEQFQGTVDVTAKVMQAVKKSPIMARRRTWYTIGTVAACLLGTILCLAVISRLTLKKDEVQLADFLTETYCYEDVYATNYTAEYFADLYTSE